MRKTDKEIVRILSIDGGGIRGIIPAIILKEIEDRLIFKSKYKPFHEVFDLIAGTSTGGLIALGLAAPKRDLRNRNKYLKKAALTVDDLIDLYEKKGEKIFPQWMFNKLKIAVQAFDEKYDATYLEDILYELFGESTIKNALTNLIVTSYDTHHKVPFFFVKTVQRQECEEDLDFYIKDIGRAATASPTFFEPARIKSIKKGGKVYSLIDGGVYAKNPALIAYTEVKKLYKEAKKVIIVSLGTGKTQQCYEYENIKHWGFVEWFAPWNGAPLINLITDAQCESVNAMLNSFSDVELHRYDLPLHDCNGGIDDISTDNIKHLRKNAQDIIRAYDEDIWKLCETLC